MGVDIVDGVVVLKRKKRLNEVVRANAYRKIVKTFVDDDTGDTLYEHIGTCKGGFEWHTGVFVVERGGKNKQ